MTKEKICRLCSHALENYLTIRNRTYFRCPQCDSIQLDESHLLDKKLEKARYDTHNNDVFDLGYQKFVSPITNYILNNFDKTHKGLDFGAGPGPVISMLLTESGYQVKQFDPFYQPNRSVLDYKYDYIIACEVIEHFNQPKKDFYLLRNLITNSGQWVFMTDIYDNSINFSDWYYKNDETHVIFYTKKTFIYLKETYGFKDLIIDKRLVVLKH